VSHDVAACHHFATNGSTIFTPAFSKSDRLRVTTVRS